MTFPDSLDDRLTIRLEVLPGNSVAERVELAARCGFDGIAFPGRLRDRFGEETLASLSGLALPVKTVSLGFEGSLCSPDPARRERCRESLRELFAFAAKLGAGSVNMPPVLIMDNPERFPPEETGEQDRLLVEQLPEAGTDAAAAGVELLLEPVNRFESDYLHTVAHAARLCAVVEHPAVGLTPDFFHMQMEELDTAGAIEEGGKWIRHVHLAENTRVEPGPGQLNFRPGFAALQRIGYGGLVEVECRTLSGPAEEAEEVLARSASYLRNEWAQSG